jgi:hypothetical protein
MAAATSAGGSLGRGGREEEGGSSCYVEQLLKRLVELVYAPASTSASASASAAASLPGRILSFLQFDDISERGRVEEEESRGVGLALSAACYELRGCGRSGAADALELLSEGMEENWHRLRVAKLLLGLSRGIGESAPERPFTSTLGSPFHLHREGGGGAAAALARDTNDGGRPVVYGVDSFSSSAVAGARGESLTWFPSSAFEFREADPAAEALGESVWVEGAYHSSPLAAKLGLGGGALGEGVGGALGGASSFLELQRDTFMLSPPDLTELSQAGRGLPPAPPPAPEMHELGNMDPFGLKCMSLQTFPEPSGLDAAAERGLFMRCVGWESTASAGKALAGFPRLSREGWRLTQEGSLRLGCPGDEALLVEEALFALQGGAHEPVGGRLPCTGAAQALMTEFWRTGRQLQLVAALANELATNARRGLVVEAFAGGLREQLLLLQAEALGFLKSPPPSLLALLRVSAGLRAVAEELICVCGWMGTGESAWASVEELTGACPQGAHMLIHLSELGRRADVLSGMGCAADVGPLRRRRLAILALMKSASRPYLHMLSRWLWSGDLQGHHDQHEEFILVARSAPAEADFMTSGFEHRSEASSPPFLRPRALAQVVSSGKALRMLLIASQTHHAALAVTPLPVLRIAFDSPSLDGLRREWNRARERRAGQLEKLQEGKRAREEAESLRDGARIAAEELRKATMRHESAELHPDLSETKKKLVEAQRQAALVLIDIYRRMGKEPKARTVIAWWRVQRGGHLRSKWAPLKLKQLLDREMLALTAERESRLASQHADILAAGKEREQLPLAPPTEDEEGTSESGTDRPHNHGETDEPEDGASGEFVDPEMAWKWEGPSPRDEGQDCEIAPASGQDGSKPSNPPAAGIDYSFVDPEPELEWQGPADELEPHQADAHALYSSGRRASAASFGSGVAITHAPGGASVGAEMALQWEGADAESVDSSLRSLNGGQLGPFGSGIVISHPPGGSSSRAGLALDMTSAAAVTTEEETALMEDIAAEGQEGEERREGEELQTHDGIYASMSSVEANDIVQMDHASSEGADPASAWCRHFTLEAELAKAAEAGATGLQGINYLRDEVGQHLPFEMYMFRSLEEPLLEQCEAIDATAVSYMLEDGGLLRTVWALRLFFLGHSKGFLHDFTGRLYHSLRCWPADGVVDCRRQRGLEQTFVAAASATSLDDESLFGNFTYHVVGDSGLVSGDPHSRMGLNFVRPRFHIPWPLNILVTPPIMELYQDIHAVLFGQQLAAHRLQRLWEMLRQWQGCTDPRALLQVRMLNIFRHDMYHVCNALQSHAFRVTGSGWLPLLDGLVSAPDLSALHEAHEAYILRIHRECFLSADESSSTIRQRLADYFDVVCGVDRVLAGHRARAGAGIRLPLPEPVYEALLAQQRQFVLVKEGIWEALYKAMEASPEQEHFAGLSTTLGSQGFAAHPE